MKIEDTMLPVQPHMNSDMRMFIYSTKKVKEIAFEGL